MHYLLKPDATVWRSDMDSALITRLANDNPDLMIDLGRLDWKKSDMPFDAGILNIALRQGTAVTAGLAVSAIDVHPLAYYHQMVAILNKELGRDSTKVPHADLMESLAEGWAEHTRDLDNQVAAAQAQTVKRAKAALVTALNAPVSDALAEHWQNLGGSLPPPVPADVANRL
jgi:hypothetical protein